MSRLVVYLQGPTALINPSFDRSIIAGAYEDDPEVASAEYGGLFRNDVQEWLPDEVLTRAVVEGRFQIPPRPGVVYAAFCDPAGGTGSDAMTLAIGHVEGGRLVTDCLAARKPPFDPESVVAEFAARLREYGLTSCVGDRYGAGWTLSSFARQGVLYEHSELDKSGIFTEAAKLFVEARVDLLDDPALVTELRTLERRPRSGGRQDSIESARGAHDDRANAVAGCLWLLALRETRETIVPQSVAIAASQREAQDVRFRPRILGVVIDSDRAYLARRIGGVAAGARTVTGAPMTLASHVADEWTRWSALECYVADTTPGQPVLTALRQLRFSPFAVDLFGAPRRESVLDVRTELAFGLGEWLTRATIPHALLHEVVGLAYQTRRGVTGLLADVRLGVADSLALTLLSNAIFQDPRTIVPGGYGGPDETPATHLGDREPTLERDGWARSFLVEDTSRSLRDYDPLNRD